MHRFRLFSSRLFNLRSFSFRSCNVSLFSFPLFRGCKSTPFFVVCLLLLIQFSSAGMNTCLAEEQATDDSRHDDRTRKNKIALVIHGGCGIERADLSADEEALARKALTHALESGYEVLKNGGTALDAVEAAIKSMENSKQFNAGAGAAFDHDGHNTLDAAIMDGSTRQAGAVASVTVVKNPISAA